ncbi:recombinase family protein [Ihubacter sp. mB4P-1]|uniref:recombinase family protein n=1 Tax=Ihubacter sp. mB4P-1 TaxID=3242370 RepID=UPI003C7C7491
MSTRESNIRVTVYVRKFSEKEILLIPERNQEEICTKVIGANENWNLIRIYQDDNCSQRSICTQLNQLIRDVENGQIDLIITPEAKQFGKDAISAYELSQKLLEYGVGIQFVENQTFTKNPMELLKLEIMA